MEITSRYKITEFDNENRLIYYDRLIKVLKSHEVESAYIITKILNNFFVIEESFFDHPFILSNFISEDFEGIDPKLIIKLLVLMEKMASISTYLKKTDLKKLIDVLNDCDLEVIDELDKYIQKIGNGENIPPKLREYVRYYELIEDYRLKGKIKIFKLSKNDLSLSSYFIIEYDELWKFEATIENLTKITKIQNRSDPLGLRKRIIGLLYRH